MKEQDKVLVEDVRSCASLSFSYATVQELLAIIDRMKAQLLAIKKVVEPINALWERNQDQLELVVRARSDGTLIGITGSNQMLRRLAEKLDEVE